MEVDRRLQGASGRGRMQARVQLGPIELPVPAGHLPHVDHDRLHVVLQLLYEDLEGACLQIIHQVPRDGPLEVLPMVRCESILDIGDALQIELL